MNKNLLLGAVGGLLIGILVGYTIGLSKGMSEAQKLLGSATIPAFDSAPPMPAGMPPQMPPGMPGGPPPAGPSPEVFQRIEMNLKLVAKDPRLAGIWIQLGNDYFDSRQHQKAIDAYGQALKLQPNNVDVITDQGVMYEQLGDYDKALANFEQAQKIDPRHAQSLFNIGVIYAGHKNDVAKAAAAWKRVIAQFPTSPQAAEARARLSAQGFQ